MTDHNSTSAPILVPVDFSEHSAAALAWGLEAARAYDAPLVVMHAVHDPASQPGYYARVTPEGDPRRIHDAARQRLTEFLDAFRVEHPDLSAADLDTLLVVGLPASRIVEVAERLDARQIVMGSQGRTALARLLLGSKAQSVVQTSRVPVTIVKSVTPDADETEDE